MMTNPVVILVEYICGYSIDIDLKMNYLVWLK